MTLKRFTEPSQGGYLPHANYIMRLARKHEYETPWPRDLISEKVYYIMWAHCTAQAKSNYLRSTQIKSVQQVLITKMEESIEEIDPNKLIVKNNVLGFEKLSGLSKWQISI